jgi:predicted MFS family arabinose efflux permease
MSDIAPSPWSPLSNRTFRSLWLAAVASNIGTWMHDVGAGWKMTELSPSPLMVALVQAAGTLPIFLLALPAGAVADIVDRRRLLIAINLAMIVVAGLLALLAWREMVDAQLLLLFTFLLGVGAALAGPAWQSLTPDVVQREQIPAASALNSAGVNVSRAIGPALGGFLVSAVGPPAVFALNALSFLGIVIVLVRWRPPARPRTLPPERIAGAIAAGWRFVRHSPPVMAALTRNAAFVLGASVLWSLLPLVVRVEMKLGATAYGILLTCIGLGAVLGAAILPRLRKLASTDSLVAAASLVFAVSAAALALTPPFPVLCLVLAASGLAWITCVTGFTVAVQVSVPSWVRARALAFHLVVFFGSMTAGSYLWGQIASRWDLPTALVSGAAVIACGLLATPFFRLASAPSSDLTPASHWPTPMVSQAPGDIDGEVTVVIEYQVDPSNAEAFVRAMLPMREIRLRDGSTSWSLVRSLEDPTLHLEIFTVGSWLEHLRQHERVTLQDKSIQDRSRALLRPGTHPIVRHFADRAL